MYRVLYQYVHRYRCTYVHTHILIQCDTNTFVEYGFVHCGEGLLCTARYMEYARSHDYHMIQSGR